MKVAYVKCTDGHWLKVRNPSDNTYRFYAQCEIVAKNCGRKLVYPISYYYDYEAATKRR